LTSGQHLNTLIRIEKSAECLVGLKSRPKRAFRSITRIATTRSFSSQRALAGRDLTRSFTFFNSANSREISASSVEGDHGFLVIVSAITKASVVRD